MVIKAARGSCSCLVTVPLVYEPRVLQVLAMISSDVVQPVGVLLDTVVFISREDINNLILGFFDRVTFARSEMIGPLGLLLTATTLSDLTGLGGLGANALTRCPYAARYGRNDLILEHHLIEVTVLGTLKSLPLLWWRIPLLVLR